MPIFTIDIDIFHLKLLVFVLPHVHLSIFIAVGIYYLLTCWVLAYQHQYHFSTKGLIDVQWFFPACGMIFNDIRKIPGKKIQVWFLVEREVGLTGIRWIHIFDRGNTNCQFDRFLIMPVEYLPTLYLENRCFSMQKDGVIL